MQNQIAQEPIEILLPAGLTDEELERTLATIAAMFEGQSYIIRMIA